MSADDALVDVRIRVRSSVYRQLYAEAQRRRLDGAGALVELMLHRQPVPRRSPGVPPKGQPPVIAPDDAARAVARIRSGTASVRGVARELGVTRGAVYYWLRKADAELEHGAHVDALVELGVAGRAAVPVPTVPSSPR